MITDAHKGLLALMVKGGHLISRKVHTRTAAYVKVDPAMVKELIKPKLITAPRWEDLGPQFGKTCWYELTEKGEALAAEGD